MAQVIDQFPKPRTAKYPWGDWLDGRVWELTPGDDFAAKPATLRTIAQQQAKRRGGKAHIRAIKDAQGAERLVLQFRRG